MKRPEQTEQITLISWCNLMSGKYPCLERIFHIPNGGKRTAIEAVKFKQMGVKPGVPDLFLPCSANGYHGLYIEMKADSGRPSANQTDWIQYLSGAGYQARICKGWLQAAHCIAKYLSMPCGDDPLYNGDDE